MIVAIDVDGAVRVAADNLGEAFGGEVGEGEVDRALDMAALECILRAGVEEEGFGFGGLGIEGVDADQALRAFGGDAGGQGQIGRAACRARVCTYVSSSEGADRNKIKPKH